VNLLGMLLAIALVGAAPTPADWSITPVFGPAVSAPGTVANPVLVPGQSSTSGYLIDHTDAIDGPLDVTAESSDPASNYEDNLLVTVAVNGVKGQTRTLGDLLRRSGIARATTALPSGPDMLTVSVELDPDAPGSTRLREIEFTFSVTLSDEVVVLPGQAGDPGPGGVPPLAKTGQVIPFAIVVTGLSLIALGILLVLRRRRRGRSVEIVQTTN
jgi:LPXTG-motif cell wall-anchored protein